MRYFIATLFLLFSLLLSAQKITISGYVRDAESGENLIGATIYEVKKQQGATTNVYGFYSLTLNPDTLSLTYSYVGYQPQSIRLALRKDTVIILKLQIATVLNEVIVSADKADKIQESTRMSTFTIPVYQIKRLPALMGETDVIKVLQLLPGVQGGSEGSSGLYVRGGGPDQNLILLDGVPVYNASHLYGFFSTFNADAINHVELVKGGFPARYGGRLSSVVDISMKEGNQTKLHGQGSIGIIASKFVIEGPIVKDRTTFIVSARRSYLNLLKASIISKQASDIADDYYFYDLNAKINHRINNRNRVYLSAYAGSDKASSGSKEAFTNTDIDYTSKSSAQLKWGNIITAARWNHVFNKKLFSNLSATFSQYQLKTLNEISNTTTYRSSGVVENKFYSYNYQSGIRDFAGRIDFDFIPSPAHYIRFGTHLIIHDFTPGVLALKSSEELTGQNISANHLFANELSAYAEDDWAITSKLKVNAGLHVSAFFVDEKHYSSLQPRIAARFLLSQDWSLKASYAAMQQYIHLLTNAGIGLPTDLWVPATAKIGPQSSRQGALGFARTFKDEYEISLEGYYKDMSNVIEYKDGASYLSVDKDWQTKVEIGRGNSYGTELFIQKKIGKVNGWVGYTLSWTNRQFDNLNGGRWFPYRYDRRHDAKIAVSYLLNDKIDLGLTWVYGTGNAVTLPLDQYDGAVSSNNSGIPNVLYYANRNNFRMRDYHRLDLNANYIIQRKQIEHRFTLSIYNVYSRQNPFYLKFEQDIKLGSILRQVSLFPILPSFTYSIKF